jgi:hypothetical protein
MDSPVSRRTAGECNPIKSRGFRHRQLTSAGIFETGFGTSRKPVYGQFPPLPTARQALTVHHAGTAARYISSMRVKVCARFVDRPGTRVGMSAIRTNRSGTVQSPPALYLLNRAEEPVLDERSQETNKRVHQS